jgi:glucan 1,3-beta-glucosidase
MDSYTFCTALGSKEANKQLRRHWRTWLNESHVANLSRLGVRNVRIPVGDWMFLPYEPYKGCFDGAVDELQRVLSYMRKYGMQALLDVHAVKDSANGLDNGGHSMHVRWGFDEATGKTTFNHVDFRAANWLGEFNLTSKTYENINYGNINHTLEVIRRITMRYKDNPVVMGIEPGKF